MEAGLPASPFLEAARLDRRCSTGCNNGTRQDMIKVCGSSTPRTRAWLSTIPRGLCPVLTRSRLAGAPACASGCEKVRSKRRWESRCSNPHRRDGRQRCCPAPSGTAAFRNHVATACKLASGTSLELWKQIRSACAERGAGFGDRATVGAGLPLASLHPRVAHRRRPDTCRRRHHVGVSCVAVRPFRRFAAFLPVGA